MKIVQLLEGAEPKMPGAPSGIQIMTPQQFVARAGDMPGEEDVKEAIPQKPLMAVSMERWKQAVLNRYPEARFATQKMINGATIATDRSGQVGIYDPKNSYAKVGPETQQGVTESPQRGDTLVTDALRLMKGPEVSDAVRALTTVLGNREYNSRRGFYNFHIKQMIDMYKKQGVAEGLNEFAPPGSGDSGDDGFSEETLKRLAAQWYNGDEDPRVERTLMAAGWEIGQDEGYDDEPGVFVVQSGDTNGDSYLSWSAHELKQGVAKGEPGDLEHENNRREYNDDDTIGGMDPEKFDRAMARLRDLAGQGELVSIRGDDGITRNVPKKNLKK